jgi:hypothetical protein
MSYDPTKDEAEYSRREVEEIVSEAVREGFAAGIEQALRGFAGLPLSVEGCWKPDTVYEPGALVYHATEQWLAKAQTASEPSVNNALWRRVDLPGLPLNREEK